MSCRMQGRRKYVWTEALDAELRRIYVDHARNRNELSAALRAFRRRMGWPRGPVALRTVELDITRFDRKSWTPDEKDLLREMAGKKSMYFMTKKLGREAKSIRNQLRRLNLSAVYLEGYTRIDAAYVLGCDRKTVNHWLARGWLWFEKGTERIPESCMRRFLKAHAEQYDLKRVDQAWFKGMIFTNFGHFALRKYTHNRFEEVA